jgi:aquaporin related protein
MATSDEAGVLDGPPHQRYRLSPVGRHLVAASGEFVGTFFFLYFGYAGNLMAILQAPYTAPNGGLASSTDIWIAVSYGFALLVNAWAFYRISGGLFNPAVGSPFPDLVYTQTHILYIGVFGFMCWGPIVMDARSLSLSCTDSWVYLCWWSC